MASPQPHRGPTSKLFVTAALFAALVAAPTAAAQTESATDVDTSSSQNVQVSPDPAPAPAAPVQPTPDPVPAPAPASTPPSGGTAPPQQTAPAEPAPAPATPAPAQPAPEPAAQPTPLAAPVAGDAPSSGSDRSQPPARAERRKPQPSGKDRSTPVDKADPLPVISGVGPMVAGLRASASDAGPPIAIAALALLTLALTSGGFLLVATRRTGAWRT